MTARLLTRIRTEKFGNAKSTAMISTKVWAIEPN
jgi:hypothetical protein